MRMALAAAINAVDFFNKLADLSIFFYLASKIEMVGKVGIQLTSNVCYALYHFFGRGIANDVSHHRVDGEETSLLSGLKKTNWGVFEDGAVIGFGNAQGCLSDDALGGIPRHAAHDRLLHALGAQVIVA